MERCAAIVLALAALNQLAWASKLIEVRPVDQEVLMVYFKDGEVRYRDNGKGPSAYTGHDFAEGDDELVAFGEELDVEKAGQVASWSLSVAGSEQRMQPVEVYRKSKVMNTDHLWNYKLDHWIFLRLPEALEDGQRYELRIESELGSDKQSLMFRYNWNTSQSEAVHVNLIGYHPESPVKSADLYLWLGDGGPRDYSGYEGNAVWLFDVENGERHEVGAVKFWRPQSETDASGRDLTGSPVWNVDFSSFQTPGRYRLVVEGVGASAEFVISEDVWSQPFAYSTRGYYYMRIGESKNAQYPPPRQPRFIPDEDPEGFTVYLTDLDPFDPEWKDHPGDTWDEPHFKPAKESMFWKRRLPGNPTSQTARGGHSDALDWDRHLAHVSNIYDILLPYILSRGGLNEDDLGIAESGNGIPDLIDEARNEVDLFLSLRVGDAYAHGLTNPTTEKTIMFQAGATTMAAWANAANCAMLAEAFRLHGNQELMAYYRDAAITAYRFAESQKRSQLDETQEIGDSVMRGKDFRMLAAAYLFSVTGDDEWEDAMARDSVVTEGSNQIRKRSGWDQSWASVAYLFTYQKVRYKDLAERMRAAFLKQAHEGHVELIEKRPSRRSTDDVHWQTPQNVQLVAIAHALSEDADERALFERALVLEADWGLGRNPSNIVEMTGFGSRHIVNCYTSGRNDGAPGLHPGHTPYNNLDPWGGSHNGSNPRWFAERGYPDWDAGGWPHQEAYFNSRYSWANGEFTPRQTMRGKQVLYAYLHWLGKE
ncbi:glycoside hydrolase family 9 protein [Pelagicoccus sp. SDUM812003]|uniref:glycoside hydrolase family 9 protein n=1 Tax=Pelagicoccus sp. SDUM812003 TaxID=3041267 RepID=UPI00280CD1CD|nr:glycoside hydrolase family 9 protein [Pelagicoccus sp. SDUM812003]MDQ8205594.1 glycoside hydrolase family 9 protein [Pelagicoccus sp. SDUM812003]